MEIQWFNYSQNAIEEEHGTEHILSGIKAQKRSIIVGADNMTNGTEGKPGNRLMHTEKLDRGIVAIRQWGKDISFNNWC